MSLPELLPPLSPCEIAVARLIKAPPALVFQAWTNPVGISNWWGPRGFSTTTLEMDVRPGGKWRHIMHGPDGRDYESEIVYIEVVRPSRLTYKLASQKEQAAVQFVSTVTFEEEGQGTRITLRMLFPTAEERDRVARDYGAVEGAEHTLERLEEQIGE
jgi:uncharacterized protein YndB with AHSA1/START domain